MMKDMEQAEEQYRQIQKQEEKEARFAKTEAPILLELYTTTDCTACVYADRMLYDAAKAKNVIALSCRIKDMSELKRKNEKDAMGDDSNYKGPMDPCVFRQWTYKVGINHQDVTLNIPSFIFNGYDQVDSSDLTLFDNKMRLYNYAYKNKVLEVFMQWKDDNTITVHLPEDPKLERRNMNASVWIIRYKDMDVQRVDEGVNKGRVLRFSNIIQDIRHIAKWHGHTRSIDVDVPKPQGGRDRGGFVIVVQEMMGDPVLAAGKLVDYPHPNDLKAAAERKAKAAAKAKQEQLQPAPQVTPAAPTAKEPQATPSAAQ